MIKETFKQAQYIREDGSIEIFEGYEVSNYGRVKSLNYRHTGKEKIRKPVTYSKYGHQSVNLHKDNKGYMRSVHRLVLSTFNPSGYFDNAVVDHISSDPTNNRLDNLRWVTLKENVSTEHCRQVSSEAMVGSNNPLAQPCVYDNKTFGCIKEAYEYAQSQGYTKSYSVFYMMILKEQMN